MIRRPIQPSLRVVLGVTGFLVAITAYGLLSWNETRSNPDQTVIPGFGQLVEGVQRLVTPNRRKRIPLLHDLKATYGRLALGLLAGITLSIIVGLGMGAFTPVHAFLGPLLAFCSKIPPTAMLAVYFVLFGLGIEMFVAIVGLSVFFSLAIAIYQALENEVSEDAVDKALTLGASTSEVIYEVMWKRILPSVIDATRLQIGPAMVFLIAAEYALADVGIGHAIRVQTKTTDMGIVYFYLVFLGATGLALEWLLVRLKKFLCPWEKN